MGTLPKQDLENAKVEEAKVLTPNRDAEEPESVPWWTRRRMALAFGAVTVLAAIAWLVGRSMVCVSNGTENLPKQNNTLTPTIVPTSWPTSSPSYNATQLMGPYAVPPFDSNQELTLAPTGAPMLRATWSPTLTTTQSTSSSSIPPINSNLALQHAVDDYLAKGTDSQSVKSYGYPIGVWDVSQVTDFSRIFAVARNPNASNFNEDISQWDVSNATTMQGMFDGAQSFNQPLHSWQVHQVTDMSRMFRGCYAFDQSLAYWDVSSVTTMAEMFSQANSNSISQTSTRLFSLTGWDVSRVTNMSSMFHRNPISAGPASEMTQWNVSSVADMTNMFQGAALLKVNFCTWGRLLSESTNVSFMFQNSGCANDTRPNLTASPPGPFCTNCDLSG